MAEKTGTSITCDRWINEGPGRSNPCGSHVHEPTPDAARSEAERRGWTRTEDGRDFCRPCSEVRANRKTPRELVPEGVRVMRVFDAAEAVGWERRDYDEETGVAHFYCCGQEVEVDSILGDPYHAKCNTCGTAIGSVLGPSFGKSSVAFIDSDKVVTEDPEHWVLQTEWEAARATSHAPGAGT